MGFTGSFALTSFCFFVASILIFCIKHSNQDKTHKEDSKLLQQVKEGIKLVY
ncbi:hypothetical protein JCM9157_540 [Halalkalibacter akibai JCM 9157]|uniref:Uncharacterized protein n=1 Tax=Halalkalibacter akibai (strain ATCC 43226 / DSM 21942 / CIP 109018 / JCM 9157 / 1139) TaxID=1236973 RepID=W4QN57_HALA3|nr:hypothetical protein JCM9157_540 [Halalkalibacter akibai JCM 9157]